MRDTVRSHTIRKRANCTRSSIHRRDRATQIAKPTESSTMKIPTPTDTDTSTQKATTRNQALTTMTVVTPIHSSSQWIITRTRISTIAIPWVPTVPQITNITEVDTRVTPMVITEGLRHSSIRSMQVDTIRITDESGVEPASRRE